MKRAFVSAALCLTAVTAVTGGETAARAEGSCGSGTWFTNVATGTTTVDSPDWLQTSTSGLTSLSVRADAGAQITFRVLDSTCANYLCSAQSGTNSTGCTFEYVGTVHVSVELSAGLETTNYVVWGASAGASGASVRPQCSDGLDNDLNGATDYPNDAGCTDPSDTTEESTVDACSSAVGVPVCLAIHPGSFVTPTVYIATADPVPASVIAGTVDAYLFQLPTGGTVTVPCVVLSVGGVPVDACAAAGGTFVTRIASLVDQSLDEPRVGGTNALAALSVCNATYTVTVGAFGVSDFPGYTVC